MSPPSCARYIGSPNNIIKMQRIDIASLRATQLLLSSQVICVDDFHFASSMLIAGADVGFEQAGTITRAALVVMRWPSMELIEHHITRIPTVMPYIPGYLSFREMPALHIAWRKLVQKPDLLMVDGHGISHPRRLGLASHFGITVNVPTIGVAKKRLCGHYMPLNDAQGSLQPLMDDNTQVGWVLRSKGRCNPLFISVGNRIGLDSALKWVKNCLQGYRLPEPTRWADAIASNRNTFQRYHQLGEKRSP